jgi:hypothetical protein
VSGLTICLFQTIFLSPLKDGRDDREVFVIEGINGFLLTPFALMTEFGFESDLGEELGEDPVVVGVFFDGEVELELDVSAAGAGQFCKFVQTFAGPLGFGAEKFA